LPHSDDKESAIFKVVLNHEEQYSIWPEHNENALGWNDAGKVGTRAECLAYIEEVWTDMRPRSLRKKMEELAQHPPAPVPSTIPERAESLVDLLCVGEHPLVLSIDPEGFKAAVDSGYVRVRFTNTRGGTELGLRLDKDACDFKEAEFEQGIGRALIVGGLSLDYTTVRCVANIELETLAGLGKLQKVP
jgi:uncharacterized protein YbdZ (MbtH family)